MPRQGERVVVYGAGGFGRAVLSALNAAGAEVVLVLDARAHEIRTVDATPVFELGQEPLAASERMDATAVIGVFNREVDVGAIARALIRRGYHRIVSVAELYDSFATDLGDRFWLAPRCFYSIAGDRIAAGAELWADKKSAAIYQSLIEHRVRWRPESMPRPMPGPQYFPDDVPRSSTAARFVDCGAFTGDTLATAFANGIVFEEIFAFEPDMENFSQLAAFAREYSAKSGVRVSLWPCAVMNRTARVSFSGAQGEASRLSPAGRETTTAVSLDDVLPNTAITEIKMDVEGSELDALHGARGTISRARPRLAICVYHRPDHLWEIPIAIHGWDLNYDLYLRCHGHCGFDTVMYAVPRQ
jgi:FkbM family methyltransferase